MLKIAICDDESTFLDNIEMFVKKYEKERGTQIFLKKYLSGLDLEDSLNLKFDIVFLDINMPGINGMELAKGIRKKDEHTIIMFLTSLKEYVFEGYQVEASGYLTKPISYKRFSSELDRVAKKVLRDSALFISIKNNNVLYSAQIEIRISLIITHIFLSNTTFFLIIPFSYFCSKAFFLHLLRKFHILLYFLHTLN